MPTKKSFLIMTFMVSLSLPSATKAETIDSCVVTSVSNINDSVASFSDLKDSISIITSKKTKRIKIKTLSPYELPYSFNSNSYDWHRLWVNTTILSSAYVGTLLVLQCLPEDATSWNRAELQDVPLFKRWHNHVIKKGPEWDHDKFYFNYLLHPYAGAAYFMAACSRTTVQNWDVSKPPYRFAAAS